MTPPSRDEARERLAAALDLLPDVKARLASGQQPNAYESGRCFIIGIGPVTNCLALAETGTQEVADMFEQALRLALLSPEQGWREIESAPMDGRSVLVFCPRASDHGYERIRLTWRKDGKWQGANNTSWPPTHWMPLPAPPTNGGE